MGTLDDYYDDVEQARRQRLTFMDRIEPEVAEEALAGFQKGYDIATIVKWLQKDQGYDGRNGKPKATYTTVRRWLIERMPAETVEQ